MTKVVWLMLGLGLSCSFAVNEIAAREFDSDFTVRIANGALVIANTEKEAQAMHDLGADGGGMVVVCKQLHVQRDAQTYTARCVDVRISSGDIKAMAKEALFDLKTSRALLLSEAGRPVQIVKNASATRMTAERIELNWTNGAIRVE